MRAGVVGLALLFAPVAVAAWHEARTEHFAIYGDQRAGALRQTAERLERLHDALAYVLNVEDRRPGASTRLSMFILRDTDEVNRYFDNPALQANGFFLATAGGPAAFVPNTRLSGREVSLEEGTLLHEYAHFLMSQTAQRALPKWLFEGYAEFAAGARFDKDGSILLGVPGERHQQRLSFAGKLTLSTVLGSGRVADMTPSQIRGFYGKSFLLVHYLQFSPDRKGQLKDYMVRVLDGEALMPAATAAFGSIEELERELADYQSTRALQALRVPRERIAAGDVTVRKLSRGEAAAMPYQMWVKRGLNKDRAGELLPNIEALAGRFKKDDAVLAVLAQIQLAARRDAQALATAQRIIARTPKHREANLVKMVALYRGVRVAPDKAKAWQAVRKQILQTYQIDQEHPLPLRLYFSGSLAMHKQFGTPPPGPNAFEGLMQALNLAPLDDTLRYLVATELLKVGRFEQARGVLQPLVSNVHASAFRDRAAKLMAKIDERLASEEGD